MKENELSFRFFHNCIFIEKPLNTKCLTSLFVYIQKEQASIQLLANSPLQFTEIQCKHLSNEQQGILLFLLKANQV